MKSRSRNSDKCPSGEQSEFGKFTNLLDKLLSVPHSEIKAKLDAEKQRKKRTPKRGASSGHASGERD
jgi:hypothetical protein